MKVKEKLKLMKEIEKRNEQRRKDFAKKQKKRKLSKMSNMSKMF